MTPLSPGVGPAGYHKLRTIPQRRLHFEQDATGRPILPELSPGAFAGPGETLATFCPLPVSAPRSGGMRLLTAGLAVHLDSSGSLVAASYGMVLEQEHGTLSVVPPFFVGADGKSVWLLIQATQDGFSPGADQIRTLVASAGFHLQPQNESLETNLGRGPGWIRIAQEQPASHGRTAATQLLFSRFDPARRVETGGRVDFKESNLVVQVEAGDPLMQQLAPVEGKPGVDIFGRVIPVRTVPAQAYRPGENVTPDPAHPDVLQAACAGCVVVAGDTVHVKEVLTIGGNVDLSTGHIRFSGTVNILGTVTEGMLVEAGGDVVVHQMIDRAAVRTHGSVYVGEGVIGSPRVQIRAGGKVVAGHLQNASVFADDDVFIARDVVNSTVTSGDTIYVGDSPGRVTSGILAARNRIEAHEVRGATMTVLRVGSQSVAQHNVGFHNAEVEKLAENLRARKRQLMVALRVNDMAQVPDAYRSANGASRVSASKLMAQIRALHSELTREREHAARALTDLQQRPNRPSVKVKGRLHAGVRVLLGKSDRTIQEDAENITLVETT